MAPGAGCATRDWWLVPVRLPAVRGESFGGGTANARVCVVKSGDQRLHGAGISDPAECHSGVAAEPGVL